ncbi:MAG: MFS transporter [Actinomycetota bacterium]|nr:MFS transporter [Actinomycetota bacterium]
MPTVIRPYLLLAAVVAFVSLAGFAVAEALRIPLLTDPWAALDGRGATVAAVLGTALLVTDVVAPVPSSLVMVAHGALFGPAVGAALSLAGRVGATAAGGALGRFASWRVAFAVYAVLALGLSAGLRRLPESLSGERGSGPFTQARLVMRRPWAAFLILLAVGEGVVMLAFLTFLAPALEATGESAAVAGVVVATYGVGVFVGLQSVKRLVRRTSLSPSHVIATGGLLLVGAYLVAASAQTVPNVLVASVLIGAAYAFVHSTLQTWATETAPEARGTATSLFVAGVYTGAAIGTTAVSGLADAERYAVLFLIAAGLTVPLVVVASLARARYSPAQPVGAREG